MIRDTHNYLRKHTPQHTVIATDRSYGSRRMKIVGKRNWTKRSDHRACEARLAGAKGGGQSGALFCIKIKMARERESQEHKNLPQKTSCELLTCRCRLRLSRWGRARCLCRNRGLKAAQNGQTDARMQFEAFWVENVQRPPTACTGDCKASLSGHNTSAIIPTTEPTGPRTPNSCS